MNGKKSKRIRKAVYGQEDYRKKEYKRREDNMAIYNMAYLLDYEQDGKK